MTFTHEEMLNAVRKAGENGQAFSCAAVREQLNVSTRNRRELSKFHRRFKTFQDEAPEEIEKIGNNTYRLKSASIAPVAEVAEASVSEATITEAVASVTEADSGVEAEAAGEPAAVANDVVAADSGEDRISATEIKSSELPHVALIDTSEAASVTPAITLDDVIPSAPVANLAVAEESVTTPVVELDDQPTLEHATELHVAPTATEQAPAEPVAAEPVAAEPMVARSAIRPLREVTKPTEVREITDAADELAPDERLIELDIFAIPDFDAPSPSVSPRSPRVSPLSRSLADAPRALLKRGQWLGRRVAELLGRAQPRA